MTKPSFFVTVKNGVPSVGVCSTNADEVLSAYRAADGECYAFIRPAATKSKSSKATSKAAVVVDDDEPRRGKRK